MKNLTWQNPEQLFVAQELINKVKSKCCGIKSTVTAKDEWLHSFYYFNDEIPTNEDFEKTMADYLTFEFKMIAEGRGYLFGFNEGEKEV